MSVYDPKTQFVANLIPRVPWANRSYIQDLLRIEEYASGKTTGFAGAMVVHQVCSKYPLEAASIRSEFAGEDVSSATADKLFSAENRKTAAEERADLVTRLQVFDEEIEAWRRAGGGL